MEVFGNIYNYIIDIINSSVIYGPIFACILIFLESLLPVLPLFVFITIVFISFGYIIGFIISYILTSLGCLFSFYLCRKYFRDKYRNKYELKKITKVIDKIDITNLAVIIAIPFTPAFLINIAASLSKIEFKKFAISIFIGKIFLVLFWGFIGTGLLESLRNPKILIIIIIMLIVSYVLSKLVSKRFNLR